MSQRFFLASRLPRLLAIALVALAATLPVGAQAGDPADLTELSLEQLMQVEVTSVSRRPESAFRAAAAVYVLTAEEIRRSGARSLPDLLRLVPGLHVARAQASSWAITGRGFNGTAANKLQVLIDDRSVYTPLTSGVFWDVQSISVEEIERIEVIRGPGATLWGANAVNGVINVITKSSADTQGGLVRLAGGNESEGDLDLVWGGRLESGPTYRVSARVFSQDAGRAVGGGSGHDEWSLGRAAFRLDGMRGNGDSWILSGEAYDGAADSTVNRTLPNPPFQSSVVETTDISGGHLLARWSRSTADGVDTAARSYVERNERDIPDFFGEVRTTFDVEVQQTRAVGSRHRLVYGLGYRLSRDDVDNSFTISWNPPERDFETYSAFFQDEIRGADERLAVTVGGKIEHHEFTGLELQPNVRFSWAVSDARLLWGAVSRAVRTPSRLDHDARFNALVLPGEPRSIVALVGNAGFDAEELLAIEIGFRTRPRDSVQIDLAAFHHRYDNLLSVEGPGAPFFEDGFLVLPFVLSNLVDGESLGAEVDLTWEIGGGRRLTAAASYFTLDLATKAGSNDQMTAASEENDPSWTAFAVFSQDLGPEIELDLVGRYVHGLRGLGVPSYLEADVRLAWRPRGRPEIELVGRNLLDSSHREFGPQGSLVERAVALAVTWRFSG